MATGPTSAIRPPARHPLADRWRYVVLPALLVALVAVCVAWGLVPSARSPLDPCLDDVRVCAGEQHTLHLVRVGEAVGPEAVRVRTAAGFAFDVLGEDPAIVAGTIVSVSGTFDAQGRLVLDRVRTHPWRRPKAVLGLLGALATALILLAAFTVRRRPEGWRLVPRLGEAPP